MPGIARPPLRRRRSAPGRSSGKSLSRLVKIVLTAGAVAGALGSILGIASTISSPFTSHAGKPPAAAVRKAPAGTITKVTVRDVRPLTYGEWTKGRAGTPEQQRTPGKLIDYTVRTRGFKPGLHLPVRLELHDVTTSKSTTFDGSAIGTRHGETCMCEAWIPVPRNGDRYYVEVKVYPPGPIRGLPLDGGLSRYFDGNAI